MKDNKNTVIPILAPIKGTILAYGITALIFIIYALLLTYTDISEKNSNIVVLAALVTALIFGGAKSAASARQKGLIWGMLTGFIYTLVMVGLGIFILPDYTLGTKTLVCLLLSLSSGGFGGIIGVNLFGKK